MEIPSLNLKSRISSLKSWIKKNPREALLLAVILLAGAALRLYRISEYMTFLGDEGRDVIIVRRLLVYGDPILIGPGTSIGNMYLGPLYYYMMAPALFLANFSPTGPAVMVALLGVATIFFIWYVAREWFGKIAAPVAAILYAVSPTIIIYSRSSWNPNIMPFFALLAIFSIWRVWNKHELKWLIVLGISFAAVLQSHYLGLLLVPTLFIFWLLTYLKTKKEKNTRHLIRYTMYGAVLFALLMSPLVIFDARHGWRNFGAMKDFFAARQTTVSARPWNALPQIYPIFETVNTRLVAGRSETAGRIVSIGMIISLIWLFFRRRKFLNTSYLLLLSWFVFALIGLGLYKQQIYDHYYGFFFPVPFILLGAIISQVSSIKYQVSKVVLVAAIGLLAIVNLKNSPVLKPPTFQLQRSEAVAKVIAEKADGQRFNLATISERNNRDVYQYFLELWGAPVVDVDPQKTEFTVTDQLFVVCEKPRKDCDPAHDPSAWITNFGWTKVDSEWEVWGGTLFKLIHAK